jgi:hypothetical protein
LPVFLLHRALIIASSRTPSGEGEVLLFTKGEQFPMDTLGSVLRIDAHKRKGEQRLCRLEGSDDWHLFPIEKRMAQGESRWHYRSTSRESGRTHQRGCHTEPADRLP